MKKIMIGDYAVDIFVDHTYSQNDAVHKYDHSYFNATDYEYPSIIGIKIYKADLLLKSAVIGASGGASRVHETSFVSQSDRIVVCCSDTIFCLFIPSLSLLWKTKADDATCFEIFKHKTDYIVHGELEISRLRNDGKIIWQQGGADIFTRLNSEKGDFLIAENYILATDWGNRKYKFDFDGNELR